MIRNKSTIEFAEVKARILTNTYTLQSNRAKYNQHRVNDTCQLCKTGTEDREHFRERPFNLKGGMFFFLKKYYDLEGKEIK